MTPATLTRTLRLLLLSVLTLALFACSDNNSSDTHSPANVDNDNPVFDPQATFRFDTFGDEAFWTDVLRYNEVVATISPETALAVGLKVDAAVLPDGILETADLTDPATTIALLGLNAIVGVQAEVSPDGEVVSFGITCALCHSDVDDSVAPGIGIRRDGFPARDLDPGLIISLSPYFDDKPEQRAVLQSWGPGKYDPYWNQDGINDPVLIAPAYGLNGVPLETYTGDGPVSFWNNYIAVTQMGGQGNFSSAHLNLDIQASPDLVTPKLPALLAYQNSLEPPTPTPGSFDVAAADRGEIIFSGKGGCARCHSGDLFTDAAFTLHDASETGSDPLYATRSKSQQYRTTPLRGVSQHPPYFHNGAHATLADVVEHYDGILQTGLFDEEKSDLVEYLKSL